MKRQPNHFSLGRFTYAAVAACVAVTFAGESWAQTDQNPLPHLVSKDGRHALIVDGAPFLMLGAQSHNSSAWPAMLPKVWPAIEVGSPEEKKPRGAKEGDYRFLRIWNGDETDYGLNFSSAPQTLRVLLGTY